MAPDEASAAALAELARQLRLDLEATREEASSVARGAGACGAQGDEAWMAFVAVHLDRLYSAAEAAFSRVVRTLGESPPRGEQWHDVLLHQVALPIQDVRPAVIGEPTEALLRPMLKFRHWLRHAYRTPFDWGLLRPVAEGAVRAAAGVQADLEVFIAWIEAAAQSR